MKRNIDFKGFFVFIKYGYLLNVMVKMFVTFDISLDTAATKLFPEIRIKVNILTL